MLLKHKRLVTTFMFFFAVIGSGHTAPIDSSNNQITRASALPQIAIIIDDIGDNYESGLRALQLPGAVAYAFLPQTPFANELAEYAAQRHKEAILHLPMQPLGEQNMGPGGLSLQMNQQQIRKVFSSHLAQLPNIVGVNNHMGSLLTQYEKPMWWLMSELARHGNLLFVDSLTSHQSVAADMASRFSIPTASRDVFLDHDPHLQEIDFQFERLVRIAKTYGWALAIGHPYPETLSYLEYWLPRLHKKGVRLVPLKKYVKEHQRRSKSWQLSLSPSPKAVKN
ncbi:MAG: divergent polysaccharide deacetylase family protein [Gammaproteobacteria bacterium]|nr:divergent polysaccharide deacetylase family protein [Gammaproteobacteria bacterium]